MVTSNRNPSRLTSNSCERASSWKVATTPKNPVKSVSFYLSMTFASRLTIIKPKPQYRGPQCCIIKFGLPWLIPA